jgi:O-antigen/teichoic acid export membrane protein
MLFKVFAINTIYSPLFVYESNLVLPCPWLMIAVPFYPPSNYCLTMLNRGAEMEFQISSGV